MGLVFRRGQSPTPSTVNIYRNGRQRKKTHTHLFDSLNQRPMGRRWKGSWSKRMLKFISDILWNRSERDREGVREDSCDNLLPKHFTYYPRPPSPTSPLHTPVDLTTLLRNSSDQRPKPTKTTPIQRRGGDGGGTRKKVKIEDRNPGQPQPVFCALSGGLVRREGSHRKGHYGYWCPLRPSSTTSPRILR